MNRVGDDLLLQSLERTEDYVHTCADAIDSKAGQILAAAAFLAIQPSVLLIAPNVPIYMFVMQMVSFLILLVAALLAHAVLEISDYPSPLLTEEWRDSIIDARREGATEEDVSKTILWGVVNFAKTRVKQGYIKNERKIRRVQWARRLTAVSFALNFLIICIVMVSRFF